jgi:hypothetical protein
MILVANQSKEKRVLCSAQDDKLNDPGKHSLILTRRFYASRWSQDGS